MTVTEVLKKFVDENTMVDIILLSVSPEFTFTHDLYLLREEGRKALLEQQQGAEKKSSTKTPKE